MIRALSRVALPALLVIGLATGLSAQTQQRGGTSSSQAQGQKGKPDAKATAKPGAKPDAKGKSAGAPAPGGAQVKLVQSFEDWSVYTTPDPKTKVCYALSQPKARTPANLKDIPGYLFVTTRPAEKVRNEISLVMNFDLKEGVEHQAILGRDQFVLLAKGKTLWVKNAAEEPKVIASMRRANDLVVKGTSAKNNATSDRYSLSGFAQALERARKECS
jgi:hypothetical protein